MDCQGVSPQEKKNQYTGIRAKAYRGRSNRTLVISVTISKSPSLHFGMLKEHRQFVDRDIYVLRYLDSVD